MIKQFNQYLIRGPRPKDISNLFSCGVKKIINLQSGFHEAFNDDDYETQFPCEYGIQEYTIPLSDFGYPKKERVRIALDIMKRSTTDKELTYIHCLHGADRTGFVCAAYRMQYMGWSYKIAKQELFEMGFHKLPYILWLPALKKWEVKSGNNS